MTPEQLAQHGLRFAPLEWIKVNRKDLDAFGFGKTYSIRVDASSDVVWRAKYMGTWHKVESVDAAIAAANADYAARVCAVLEPIAQPMGVALPMSAAHQLMTGVIPWPLRKRRGGL